MLGVLPKDSFKDAEIVCLWVGEFGEGSFKIFSS